MAVDIVENLKLVILNFLNSRNYLRSRSGRTATDTALKCRYAHAELSRSGAVWENNAIQIYAEAESLEYYLRVAIAASDADRVTIIVNIPKNNGRKNEMRETVRMMLRRHKNIFYRMM